MAFKFEGLKIWQKSFDLCDTVHLTTLKFPKIELFSLTSQIKRAADSVVLNICEGSAGLSNAKFARILNISPQSAIEVVGCLMLAKKRDYIDEIQYTKLYDEYEHLCKMITKFKDFLK